MKGSALLGKRVAFAVLFAGSLTACNNPSPVGPTPTPVNIPIVPTLAVKLSAAAAAPGSRVTATTTATPGKTYALTWEGKEMATGSADPKGLVSLSVTIPKNVASGSVDLAITGDGGQGTERLTLEAPALKPAMSAKDFTPPAVDPNGDFYYGGGDGYSAPPAVDPNSGWDGGSSYDWGYDPVPPAVDSGSDWGYYPVPPAVDPGYDYNYGPTAVCWDGSFSYSQHASGTCSDHGGVYYWVNYPGDY